MEIAATRRIKVRMGRRSRMKTGYFRVNGVVFLAVETNNS